jgi:putative transposase
MASQKSGEIRGQYTHSPIFAETFLRLSHFSDVMARIARFVAEGLPHHVTQRGNARKIVFEDPEDRRVYLNLLRSYAEEHRLSIWAWCLMTNHIHLLAVPRTPTALARALGRTHSDYARYRNAKSGSWISP